MRVPIPAPIERTTLLDRTAHLEHGGLLLLEAPAGYGKTCSLLHWTQLCRRARRRVAWLELRSSHADPKALAQALTGVLEQAGVKLPTGGQDFAANFASMRERIVIVLDDYQNIENSAADGLLAELFRHIPANTVIALATRHRCAVPLSTVLLEGRLQRLDGNALLFSRAETRALFDGRASAAQLSRLHELSEGWPAALRIAQLCVPDWTHKSIDLRHLPAWVQPVDDYIVHEILNRLDESALALLTECAIVEEMEPALCNAIRQATDSTAILSRLAAHETFLTAVDFEHKRWRLPACMRQTLLRRASAHGPDAVRLAHQRAAQHFDGLEQIQRALHHYIEADDADSAARMLERVSPMLHAARHGDDSLQAMLDLLPKPLFKRYPRLLLASVYLDYKQGMLDEARVMLGELASRTSDLTRDRENGNDAQFAAEALCVRQLMEIYRRAVVSRDFLRWIEDSFAIIKSTDVRLARFPHIIIGVQYRMRGDLQQAEEHFIHCSKLNELEEAPFMELWLQYHYGMLALARGNLQSAKYHLQTSLRLCRSNFRGYRIFPMFAQLALAEIDYETDALSDAQSKLDAALYMVEHVEGWSEPYVSLYETAMMNHWHAGRIEQIEPLLARGSIVARVGVLLENFLRALRLRFLLLQGRYEAAATLVERERMRERWNSADFQEEYNYREWDLLGLCLGLLAFQQHELDQAQAIAERIQHVAVLSGREKTGVRAALLQAAIANRRGQEVQSIGHMKRALETGHALGLRRVFLDEGELVRPALRTLIDNDEGEIAPYLLTYARSLLTALARKEKSTAVDHAALSERENDVLRELSHGYSNKVIARKFGLSARTVKFHVHNVFRKLGVHKRTAAVAEAHRRGWLS